MRIEIKESVIYTARENPGTPPWTDAQRAENRLTLPKRGTAVGAGVWMDAGQTGHKPSGVHDGYLSFSDGQITGAFEESGLMLPPRPKS
jgi:hypothetical protein